MQRDAGGGWTRGLLLPDFRGKTTAGHIAKNGKAMWLLQTSSAGPALWEGWPGREWTATPLPAGELRAGEKGYDVAKILEHDGRPVVVLLWRDAARVLRPR